MNLSLLLFVGLAEGIGLGAAIPLLESLQEQQGQQDGSFFTEMLGKTFSLIGISVSVQNVLIFFIVVTALKFALQAAQLYVSRLISSGVTRDLRNRAFKNVVDLSLETVRTKDAGDYVATIFTSSQNAGAAVENVFAVAVSLVFCLVYLSLNLLISVELTLVSLAVISLSGLLITRRFSIELGIGRETKSLVDRLTGFLMDKLGGMSTIKTYNLGGKFVKDFGQLTERYRQVAIDTQKNRIISNLFVEPQITFLSVGLGVYAISYLDMSIVHVGVFFLIVLRTVPMLKSANSNWLSFINNLPHFTHIDEIIKKRDARHFSNGRRVITKFENEIILEDVAFQYGGANIAAVDGINLAIKCNTTVALVGESGSGKTTAINLAQGNLWPTSGRILIDGIDFADIDRTSWNALVAVVDQEAHLFNATIAENIRLGQLDASDADVRAAARMAHADMFIEEMADGYDTVVGDRGARLSGGQRQRIALARALVRDPDVLILDEATSALDSESERLVQEAIKEASASKTVIVIAHRLSTVTRADKIVVMDKGRIVAEGTHAELSESNPIYKNFVQLQFTDQTNKE